MGHVVITIGREFGSGGHKIGQLLAVKLGIPYYDRELLMLSAQRGGLDEKKLEKYDEKKHNPYLYEVNYEGNAYAQKGVSVQDALFALQSEIIREIGENMDAVIVGRCADAVLREAGIKTVSVFVAAPFEMRVKRTMELEEIDEKTAAAMTRKKDKRRKQYYESRTGKRWGVPESYDMYFDAGKQSPEEIAEQIVQMYQSVKKN